MTLSSIDSLRTLQTRGFSHSGGGDEAQGSNVWWKEHKKMMDQMLEKKDQGESVEDEEKVIQSRRE